MRPTEDPSSHITFSPVDTLAISRKLQASGIPKEQADTQASIFGDIITHNIATKTDIARIEEKIEVMRKESKAETARIEERIENLRKESKAESENLRKESKAESEAIRKDLIIEIDKIHLNIIKWVAPLMIGQLMAALGLIKIFIR